LEERKATRVWTCPSSLLFRWWVPVGWKTKNYCDHENTCLYFTLVRNLVIHFKCPGLLQLDAVFFSLRAESFFYGVYGERPATGGALQCFFFGSGTPLQSFVRSLHPSLEDGGRFEFIERKRVRRIHNTIWL